MRTSAAGAWPALNSPRSGDPATSWAPRVRDRPGTAATRAALMLSASGRCACPDDLRYRSGIGGKPVSTQALLKQLVGLGVGKDIKHQQAGRLYRGKAGQLRAAGHPCPAGQRAREQRGDPRVVV